MLSVQGWPMCSELRNSYIDQHFAELTDRRAPEEEAMNDRIFDPPVVNHKGRPQTQRLTGPTEGRPRGGGARIQGPDPSQNVARRQNRCSKCHLVGHNRTSCPTTTR